ncbi:MAG: helix-turn-helix domain-containing protein [Nitrospirota bacterium]|nr:helix-turn-helix domain-containing protein [Nitrospirota bacterium]
MDGRFGSTVRILRTKKGIGLRKFAKQVGISPTYLSKIERGEFPPPAEDKVVAIADALEQDHDELLALSGRIATELKQVILRAPKEFGSLLRMADGLRGDGLAQLSQAAEKLRAKPAGRSAKA